MSGTLDLTPQARVVARLVQDVTDGRLDAATPCPDYSVRRLLGHIHDLAGAFRAAARKETGPLTGTAPGARLPELPDDWRTALPAALDALAAAWRDPAAWSGDTRAGGLDLPGAVAGAVAADELVVHGWDLARAAGLPYTPDPAALDAAHGMLAQAASESATPLFGPPVPVPREAPLLDRVIGLSGRRPDWRAPR